MSAPPRLILPVQGVLIFAAILAASPAIAQNTPPQNTPPQNTPPDAPPPAEPQSAVAQSYVPADFARFNPRTALDMVRNIPDFLLVETNDDRGLGQASENVLINGQRVASKANDAQATLRQISASAVVRIDIVDGARLGIPGLTGRVANVIVESNRIRGQFGWEGQQRQTIADQIYTGSISASGRIGATDFTISLSNADGVRRGGRGPEIVTDASGVVLLTRDQTDSFHRDVPRLSGTIARAFDDGSLLNLNLSVERDIFLGRFFAAATPVGGVTRDERFINDNKEWTISGGGDYEFALGDGRLKIIGLQSYSHDPRTSTFVVQDRTPGAIASGSLFRRDPREGESVIRTEYGWTVPNGSWQIAVEGAYNFLDVVSRVGTLQTDGSFTDDPLAGGTSFVDEWRGEVSVTRGWTLSNALSLQATLGGEYSRIRQTSAGGLSREFYRPKGSVSLAWTASPRLTINAAVRRQVGQLSFDDFSSAVDLLNNNNSAGNVNLVPEQSWRFELEAVRQLGGFGSVTVGSYAELITDIVDNIPISATEEGVGNLPSARRYGFSTTGTLTLDPLGWRGARIDFNGEWLVSRVRDPLTGQKRRISDDIYRNWTVTLRHDIPGTPIAWGASIGETVPGPSFRLDQFFRSGLTRPLSGVFVEHKDVAGLTVRFSLRNILGTADFINRDVYVNRRDGPVDFRERQIRNIGLIGVLAVSGSF